MAFSSKFKSPTNIALLTGLVVVLLLPVIWPAPYILHTLITIWIYSVIALSTRLIMLTGQWTFGQAGFLAIGGYAAVILMIRMGLSFWAAAPLAGLAAALFAILIGYPILRTRGIYFSMLTLSLGEVVRLVALEWKGLTGGASGIINILPPGTISIGSWTLAEFTAISKPPYYYLALAILLITIIVMWRLDRSKLGRVFRAIKQNDSLAWSLGINVVRYKVIAFAIGSFFAGISGAFFPVYLGIIYPANFHIWQSIYPVIHVIVGGLNYLAGPIIGTLFMTILFEVTRALPQFQPLIYAIVLVVVVLLLPNGLMGLGEPLRNRLTGLTRRFSTR